MMSKTFLTSIKDTLLEEQNFARTENGALGYRTTGKELLDLNFAVSSLRREKPREGEKRPGKAGTEPEPTKPPEDGQRQTLEQRARAAESSRPRVSSQCRRRHWVWPGLVS